MSASMHPRRLIPVWLTEAEARALDAALTETERVLMNQAMGHLPESSPGDATLAHAAMQSLLTALRAPFSPEASHEST
jgi:hypothetical protein